MVGHVMRRAGGELLGLAVHQKRTRFHIKRRALFFADHPLDCRPLAEGDHMRLEGGHRDSTKKQEAHY
jgi:hypothetical protein